MFGVKDAEKSFRLEFIDKNRGRPLFLIRFEQLKNIKLNEFLEMVPEYIVKVSAENAKFKYYILGDARILLFGIASDDELGSPLPNIDAAIGRLHDEALKKNQFDFDFGVGRTQCNYISDIDEIFAELDRSAMKNLKDNLVRWSWTYLNRANDYFATEEANAVIQPIIHYDIRKQTYSMKGGEVFVGGQLYQSYFELMSDIPDDQDLNRIELLILEKLVMACREAPGLLKFNISPQTLLDTFDSAEKAYRFKELLTRQKLAPDNIRLELIEKPYEEKETKLKDVCRYFWQFGISFAADDFGVKSQSHQVVLDLGEMIKEFKLDPISFKFKAEEDHTKFLDNLAFIDYCIRLADNREAIITAEAVDDFDTLRFLIAHQVYHFQANMFCGKMAIHEYKSLYKEMQDLPESAVNDILGNQETFIQQKEIGNIYKLARQLKLY
ncbi:MAG: EAL domain-containing protein [Leptospiraceae bacterium]|nr:EAL domain-containing protein [Leptospiraceae bacterium]MCB1200864.1 EAL domain-containing protein [Leptospiraceae bacterium]